MIRRKRVAASTAVVALLAVLGAGCSDDTKAEPTAAAERVVEITMTDDAFTPKSFTAKVNETVRFRFINLGEKRHEAVIGDQAYQDAHELMMESMTTFEVTTVPPTTASPTTSPTTAAGAAPASFHSAEPVSGSLASERTRSHPGMTDPNAVSVEPGETGEIVYSFAKRADLFIACHEPGHLMAGMIAPLTVR